MDYGGWYLYFYVPYNSIANNWSTFIRLSVGASLSGENLFDVLIGMEEHCFDPRQGCLTGCLHGLYRNRTMYRTLWASRIQSCIYSPHILTIVSSYKIFSVSLTISLLLSHVISSLLTEIDKLYMWQTVHTTIAGEEAITHHDWWMILT